MVDRGEQPLIYGYLKKYQEDPQSRVFAPLAEAYRKAGLVDEAIEIAREGLRIHPEFVGGRVALARALFDKKLYPEVIDQLAPVVRDNPDNLIAQRLSAESNLMVGRMVDALNAYKMLLFFAPHDPETGKIVRELEAQAYQKGTLVLRTDSEPAPEFDVRPLEGAIDDAPEVKLKEWMGKIEKLQAMLQSVERYRGRARG
jgi:tetratricopeptide (TPR) repeat protein